MLTELRRALAYFYLSEFERARAVRDRIRALLQMKKWSKRSLLNQSPASRAESEAWWCEEKKWKGTLGPGRRPVRMRREAG
jgi:hypothetical protein